MLNCTSLKSGPAAATKGSRRKEGKQKEGGHRRNGDVVASAERSDVAKARGLRRIEPEPPVEEGVGEQDEVVLPRGMLGVAVGRPAVREIGERDEEQGERKVAR